MTTIDSLRAATIMPSTCTCVQTYIRCQPTRRIMDREKSQMTRSAEQYILALQAYDIAQQEQRYTFCSCSMCKPVACSELSTKSSRGCGNKVILLCMHCWVRRTARNNPMGCGHAAQGAYFEGEDMLSTASVGSRGRRHALRMLGRRQGGHLPHLTAPFWAMPLPWLCTHPAASAGQSVC